MPTIDENYSEYKPAKKTLWEKWTDHWSNWWGLYLVIAWFVLVIGLAFIDHWSNVHSKCETFKNIDSENVPARCFTNFNPSL